MDLFELYEETDSAKKEKKKESSSTSNSETEKIWAALSELAKNVNEFAKILTEKKKTDENLKKSEEAEEAEEVEEVEEAEEAEEA